MISGHCEREADVAAGRLNSTATPAEFHQRCQLIGCTCPEHLKAIAGQRDIFGGEVA